MAIKIVVVVVVLLGCNSLVWAETWVPINKPGQLKELIGGVTVEYTHENGEKATATYNEDGEGSLTVGLAVFPRKWAIVGDDKACYTSEIEKESKCFTFDQNIDDPTQYCAFIG